MPKKSKDAPILPTEGDPTPYEYMAIREAARVMLRTADYYREIGQPGFAAEIEAEANKMLAEMDTAEGG